ncbi:MAG: DEAD/DEAH box helicase [Oligoflexia bacterium]|nr:DEAD/DEAH box helicase [Oligoflexia bacterium]
MSFLDFPLDAKIIENLNAMGFSGPTDIQKEVLPIALDKKDISGLSRTGTGKTAAFLIPTIQSLLANQESIALCLAPTRELATQIQQEADRISKNMGLSSVCIIGGVNPEEQIQMLQKGARIVIGTPGRIIDLYKEKALDLKKVNTLVFDEADRMFDMGFIKDMRYLLTKIPKERQILLFSATMNFSVLNLIYEFGSSPVEVNISKDQVTAEKIKQIVYHVSDEEKGKALIALCKKHESQDGTIIVFSNYKDKVSWIAGLLNTNNIPAKGLSSLYSQDKRNTTIEGFKNKKFRALVATDVASRGIDVDDVVLVINYHLPEEAASYVHRIGRTARAGRSGVAVSLCGPEDAYNQIRIEEFLGTKIPVEWLQDEDMNIEINPYVEQNEQNTSRKFKNDRPERTKRHNRPERSERSERPERPERSDRSERSRSPKRERFPNNNRKASNFAQDFDPKELPSPITGNPIIYCMKTGKPKNLSDSEFNQIVSNYNKNLSSPKRSSVNKKKVAPELIKKISTRVTSLFTSKNK